MINIINIKKLFPIFKHNKLVFLDNANTTHKPISVIYSELKFYQKYYCSSNRSIYSLSNNISIIIEKIRYKISKFIHKSSSKEIIFVKGCTEAINLIANCWGNIYLNNKDNIIITQMEHHANILPWIFLSYKKKINIKIISINKYGILNYKELLNLLDKYTKIVSITYISNVLGTINPIKKIIKIIRNYNKNITIIIDGAQSYCLTPYFKKLDFDFICLSAHKMYGPTGIGILYGKKNILDQMLPYQGGGGIINDLNINNNYIKLVKTPWKFEAGTLNISGIIGMYKSINFLKKIGLKNYILHEKKLTKYFIQKLLSLKFIKIYGLTNINLLHNRRGIISFNFKKYHSYDIANLLDNYNIAIRSGHLCSLPLMKFYKVNSMCRVSLGIYNNKFDIDYFIDKLIKINNILTK